MSLQQGAVEYFTVMDVPHGGPVCDAFGAQQGFEWGVFGGDGGGLSVLQQFPLFHKNSGPQEESSTWAGG